MNSRLDPDRKLPTFGPYERLGQCEQCRGIGTRLDKKRAVTTECSACNGAGQIVRCGTRMRQLTDTEEVALVSRLVQKITSSLA